MDERIILEIEAVETLSYALAHNRVPIVRQVVASNLTGKPVDDLTLSIELSTVDGNLSKPFLLKLDSLDPGITPLPIRSVLLEPARLADLEEQRPGILLAKLNDPDGVAVASTESRLQVLAHNQWLMRPIEVGLEALAAFVMPNHPRIAQLLDISHQSIGKSTGSSNLQGYQRDTDDLMSDQRSDAIARAIYDSMSGLGINYINPPASWDASGQKIRTPQQVLDGRQGTCLDTSVVMAAAFEQAGLAPVVVVVSGHAFAAYFRGADADEIAARNAPLIDDVELFIGLVEAKQLRLVETTTVTSGSSRAPFDTAIAANNGFLGAESGKFLAAVNILGSRSRGVVPLPARVRTATGEVTVVEYRPMSHGASPSTVSPVIPTGARVQDNAPARVQQWKTSLLDLSERNSLISYNPIRHGISTIVAIGSLGLIEDSLHYGHHLQLVAHDQITELQREAGSRTAADLAGEVPVCQGRLRPVVRSKSI